MADITMPQLGETVTEGTITKWFKSVGDEISEDEPLFEVSTDKVDSEVPSPESGYLAEILVEEGDTVDVGTKLAVISSEAPSGDGQKSEKAEKSDEESKDEKEEEEEEDKDEEEAAEAEDEEDEEQQEDDEAAEDVPEDDDEDEGETPDEEARPAKAEAEADEAEEKKESKGQTKTEERKDSDSKADRTGAGDGQGSGKVLSPVVRKLIAEHDLDPDQIEGTGQGGRITRADVLSVIDTGKSKGAPKEEKKEKEDKKAPAREAKREEAPRPAAAKAGADD